MLTLEDLQKEKISQAVKFYLELTGVVEEGDISGSLIQTKHLASILPSWRFKDQLWYKQGNLLFVLCSSLFQHANYALDATRLFEMFREEEAEGESRGRACLIAASDGIYHDYQACQVATTEIALHVSATMNRW